MTASDLKEYDFEPVPGLPENLPAGERLLWRGSPEWQALARRPFHVRLIAIYFAVLVAWSVASALGDGMGIIESLGQAQWVLLGGLAVVGMMLGLSVWVARSTIYTVTNRRLVMRFGLALPMAINIPFSKIDGAALKLGSDGTGDIALALGSTKDVAYVMFWPHVRLWRTRRTEPALIGVADAANVARVLGDALALSAVQPGAVQVATAPAIRTVRKPVADVREEAPAGAQPAI